MKRSSNSKFENIKMGDEYKFEYDDRYFLQTAEAAMKGDVIRGLVELITNSDDSYSNIGENNGIIKITIDRKRKSKNSTIKVLDMAAGMTMDEMLKKLKRVGGMTSGFIESKGQRVRGLMGRGAKECVVFGNLKYQSIKYREYSEVELKKPAIFKPVVQKKATAIERIDIDIERGNGTLVTLEVGSQFKIPSHESLINNLPRYYSLRDIAADPNRKLILTDGNNSKKEGVRLQYNYPQGEIVFDDKISIPDYPEAEAHLVIQKSPNRIKNDSGSPYWEGGILIKSNYAIHEVSSLSKKIENNPYFDFYFGKVICPYIDKLAIDYENAETRKWSHSAENPSRIIDPLRSEGIAKNHPFTKSLYREIKKHVNVLLKKDEDSAKQKTKEIENNKTKDRFRKLASEVGKFIKDNIEDVEIEDENYLTESEIRSKGIVIIPGGLKIPIGEERKAYVYCCPSLEQKEKHVVISTDSDILKLSSEIIGLIDRGKDDGILVGSFSVKGSKKGSTKIKLIWGKIDKYLSVSVVESSEINRDIKEFQFEKDNYSVKEGKKKNIRIFAHYQKFIYGRVKLKMSIENNKYCKLLTENIILDYNRKSEEIFGRRLAIGTVKIAGLKAGGPIKLSVTLQDKEISTKIRVIPKKDFGQDFEIKIVDEDLGDQRSVLIENKLKINGRHKNIKRYLGPGPDFVGQDSIHFRLLMAELIADTVARRVLELNAQKNVAGYRDMDATGFYRKHRGFMNSFLEKAHLIQIPGSEIDIFKK